MEIVVSKLYVFCLLHIILSLKYETVRAHYCHLNPNPCMNKGTCVSDPVNDEFYSCQCSGNFGGRHCEEEIVSSLPTEIMDSMPPPRNPVCTPATCKGDCKCYESCKRELGYYCQSDAGYLGKNCSIPPPTLHCHTDQIVIVVSEEFVAEINMGWNNGYLVLQPDLHLATSRSKDHCRFTRTLSGTYTMIIPLPFTACGTKRFSENDSVYYVNEVWYNRALSSIHFDVPVPALSIKCTYNREFNVTTYIQPIISPPAVIDGKMSINPVISLCKRPSCPGMCPANFGVSEGGYYTVGERIYVKMSLDTGADVTAVDRMMISCTQNLRNANETVDLVVDGCAVSTVGLPFHISQAGSSHTVCVSFQIPRALECRQIYIHATLSSCSPLLVQHCLPSHTSRCLGRKRRSLDSTDVQTFGPIYIINPTVGRPELKVYPGDDETLFDDVSPQRVGDQSKMSSFSRLAYISAICAVLLMLITLLFRISLLFQYTL